MAPAPGAGPLRPDERRRLARAISAAERGEAARDPQPAGAAGAGPVHLVGLTGPPGSGKSTLADALVGAWRAADRTVAVLAVDPSSPFSGGAILGDRVRMQDHATDPQVFIRSMGARGHLGGLAAAARTAVRLLEAAGFERILIETVGVGQSEVEVTGVADTVVVVTTPAAGDGVQVIKAGILEVADVFVVNKADLDGAERAVRELQALAHAGPSPDGWTPPVVATIATERRGIDPLLEALDRHHALLAGTNALASRRAARLADEVVALVAERAAAAARRLLTAEGLADGPGALPGARDPARLADRLLARLAEEAAQPAAAPAAAGEPR